jgi:hypothetical protein
MLETNKLEGSGKGELLVDGFMLPDPRLLSVEELRILFLKLSQEFTTRLVDGIEPKEIVELQNLQIYIRDLVKEIEIRDKSVLKSL